MKIFPARILRRGIVMGLVAVLGVVVFHLFFRRPTPARPEPEKTGIDGTKVDRKEDIQHLTYESEDLRLEVRGDRFFLGKDGLNHLEGHVALVEYGGPDGPALVMTADAMTYDQDFRVFTASGQVRIREKDVVLESVRFIYERDRNVLQTDRGILYSSARIFASARNLSYFKDRRELSLSGDIRAEILVDSAGTEWMTLSAHSFSYDGIHKSGWIKGQVSVVSESVKGSSEELRFQMTEDEKFLASMTSEGGPRWVLSGRNMETPERQEIAATSVRAVFVQGRSRPSRIEADGNCRADLLLPSGEGAAVRGNRIAMGFSAEGDLANMEVAGYSSMELQAESGPGERLEGETLHYNRERGTVTLRRGETWDARLVSAGVEIQGDRITLGMTTGSVGASGDIKCLLTQGKETRRIGFFSHEKPVFVICRELRLEERIGRLSFAKDVRIWQEGEYITAQELEIEEDSGAVFASGDVHSLVYRRRNVGSETERFEVMAGRMEGQPEKRLLFYEGDCSLVRGETRFTAESLAIAFNEASEEIEGMTAKTNVLMSHGRMQARAGEARYDPESDTVVFTDRPILEERGKSSIRGDKLTFHLAGDKIFIENRGLDRSVARIRS